MDTKAPVEIIDIADDDDIPVENGGVIPIPPSGIVNSSKKLRGGTSKDDAIPVENYCQSMENRDFAIAIMASLFPKSSKRPKKRCFIDLSRDFDEYPDHENPQFSFRRRRLPAGIPNFETGESSNSQFFTCDICVDSKPSGEFFPIEGCTHSYCTDCIHKYIVSKLQDNITQIPCPVSGCAGLLEPENCRSILPHQVFDRWGAALCEAGILDTHKFYCPYKDCSALLINDTGMIITLSECPICRRYFCAHCNVPWHLGIECGEFQSLNKDEREKEDIMLLQLAKLNKWIRCPKCRFYVEKSQGCLFMRCRCGYTFCYSCGTPLVSHGCPNCKQ